MQKKKKKNDAFYDKYIQDEMAMTIKNAVPVGLQQTIIIIADSQSNTVIRSNRSVLVIVFLSSSSSSLVVVIKISS